ncbi:MAG TPA: ATP-binding protein [Atribacterota bacterium]|nr:ATP-binding protein [Atribacterota bacterium]
MNNDVSELIHQGENLNTEFKRSLRWDIKLNKVNKDLEKAVMRIICGFMNVEGGILLIGVGDDGIIEGLESDYKTFKNMVRIILKVTCTRYLVLWLAKNI